MRNIFMGGKGRDNNVRSSTSLMEGSFKRATQVTKHGKKDTTTSEERYKKLVSDKMDAMKKEMMLNPRGNFGIKNKDGTAKPISETVLKTMEIIAARKAKKELKAARKEVEIKGKYLTGQQGGRIDSKGKIYNSANQVVGSIDPKTGKIKNKAGTVVGKYKGDSFSDFKVAQLVAKSSPAGGAGGALGHNPWGVSGGSKPTFNPWGSTSSDDNKGGGWW